LRQHGASISLGQLAPLNNGHANGNGNGKTNGNGHSERVGNRIEGAMVTV
jgi:hypothetical protein